MSRDLFVDRSGMVRERGDQNWREAARLHTAPPLSLPLVLTYLLFVVVAALLITFVCSVVLRPVFPFYQGNYDGIFEEFFPLIPRVLSYVIGAGALGLSLRYAFSTARLQGTWKKDFLLAVACALLGALAGAVFVFLLPYLLIALDYLLRAIFIILIIVIIISAL